MITARDIHFADPSKLAAILDKIHPAYDLGRLTLFLRILIDTGLYRLQRQALSVNTETALYQFIKYANQVLDNLEYTQKKSP